MVYHQYFRYSDPSQMGHTRHRQPGSQKSALYLLMQILQSGQNLQHTIAIHQYLDANASLSTLLVLTSTGPAAMLVASGKLDESTRRTVPPLVANGS